MGRSKYAQLKRAVENVTFVKSWEDIYFYGSSGSGKSHILAALVCQLIREGERVVYIPDCQDFLDDPYKEIQVALCSAFYDDSMSLEIIKSAHNTQDLIDFWRTRREIILVVDHLNALEIDPNDKALKVAKTLLRRLTLYHHYIYSASANEMAHRDVELKQASINTIKFLGGMDENETDQWFKHYSDRLPSLSKDDCQLVKHLTGCIPLLLCSLFKFKGGTFDEREFLRCDDLIRINKDINNFYSAKSAHFSPHEEEQFMEVTSACLRGGYNLCATQSLYDLRYFYFDEKRIGHYTCGVAFEAMVLILREHKFQHFTFHYWYIGVERKMDPVARYFIAEQLCLNHISTHGLPVVDSRLTRMEAIPFSAKPNWDTQLDAGLSLRLYTPTTYNFPNIDAIVLWLDLESKAAHLYPIRVTLSRDHSNSENDFYETMWHSWILPIKAAGLTVKSTFIWIDKKQPAAQHNAGVTRSTRQGVNLVQLEHLSTRIGIRQVNKCLADMLSL